MKIRNYVNTKFALLTLLVVAVSSLAFAAITTAKRTAVAPPAADAKDPRSLHEKAKRGGGKFIGNADFNDAAKKINLNHLAKDSDIVVIATTESNVCKLLPNGRMITTDYRVRIEDALKGSVTAGDTLTVSLPGGKIGFEDNSTAEVQTPWFKKMVNNQRYILFLQANPSAGSFVTTGGPQGVFEIPAKGQEVLSHSGIKDDPVREHHKSKPKDFLKKLRQAISE